MSHFVSHTPGAGSDHEVIPSFLQTLLEGSAEQLYVGPISQYEVDDLTKTALSALKGCIDDLSPEHVKALVDLLVIPSFYHYHNGYHCAASYQILDKKHPTTLT
uniref:Uncharacterized protein n=1 Tax=Falco tinnunculus TaxID=100819 RepID=A0A8C4TNB3_FALTI